MREETRKKLDARLSGERWAIVTGVVLLLAVAAGLTVAGTQIPGSDTKLNAVARSALIQVNPDFARLIVDMRVELENGQMVQVSGMTGAPPKTGDRIVITKRSNWLGFTSLYWFGEMQPPLPAP